MRNVIIFGILIAIVSIVTGCISIGDVGQHNFGKAPVEVTYYYSPGCDGCDIIDGQLSKLEKDYKGEIIVTRYDVNKEFNKYREDLNKYHVDSITPLVIFNNQTFGGYNTTVTDSLEATLKFSRLNG